jgi:hypothetical protein
MSSDSVKIEVELLAKDIQEKLQAINQKLNDIRVSTVEGAEEATAAVNQETEAYNELELELQQVLVLLERLKEVGNSLPEGGIKIISSGSDFGSTVKLLSDATQGVFFFVKTVKLLKDSKDPISELKEAFNNLTNSISKFGDTTPQLKGLKDQILLTAGGAKELGQSLSSAISNKLSDKVKEVTNDLKNLKVETQKAGNNINDVFEKGAVDAEFFDGSIKDLSKNLAKTGGNAANLKSVETALKNANGAAQGATKSVVNFNTTVAGAGASPAKGIQDITNVLNGTGTAANKTSNEIKKVTNQPTGKFFSQFTDGLKGLINTAPKASSAIGGIGTAGKGIAIPLEGGVKAIGQFIQTAQAAGPAGLAAAAAIAAFVAAVAGFGIAGAAATKIFSENEKRTEELRKKTMLAAASATLLDTAFRQTGQTTENLTKVVNEFQLKLEQARTGSEKAAAQFKQLGIDPEQFDNVDEALKAVIVRLNELPNDAAAASKAIDLLGTEGFASLKDAAKVIEETQKRLGVFEEANNKARAQLAQFDRALSNARISFDGLAAVLAAEVLPAFTEAARSVDEFFRLLAESEEVRKVFRVLSDSILALVIGIKEVVKLSIELGDALLPVLSGFVGINKLVNQVSGGLVNFGSVADGVKVAFMGLTAAISPVLGALVLLGQNKTAEKRIQLEQEAAEAQKKSAQAQVEAINTSIEASQRELAIKTENENAKRNQINLTTQTQIAAVQTTIASAAEQATAIAKIQEESQKQIVASLERTITEINNQLNLNRAKGAGETQLKELLTQLRAQEEMLAAEKLKLQQLARDNQQKVATESEKAALSEIALVRAQGLASLNNQLAEAGQVDAATVAEFATKRLEIERKAIADEIKIREESLAKIVALFGDQSQQVLEAETRILELRNNLSQKEIELKRSLTDAIIAEQSRQFTEIDRITSEKLDKLSQKNFQAAERDRAIAAKFAADKIEIERKALEEKIKLAEANLRLLIIQQGQEAEAVKAAQKALNDLRNELRNKILDGERALGEKIQAEREKGLQNADRVFTDTTKKLQDQLKRREISEADFNIGILKAQLEFANERLKINKKVTDEVIKQNGEASDQARAAIEREKKDKIEADRLTREFQLASLGKLREEERALFSSRQGERDLETQSIQDNLAQQESLFKQQKITEQQLSETRLQSVIRLSQIQSDAAEERVKEAEKELELAKEQAAAKEVIIEKELKLKQARAEAFRAQMQGLEAIMKAEEMAASQGLMNAQKFLVLGQSISGLLNKIAEEAKVTFSPENFDQKSIADASAQLETFKKRLEEIDKANLTLGFSSIRAAVRDIFQNSVDELQQRIQQASIKAAKSAAQARIDAERQANTEILSQLDQVSKQADEIRRQSAKRQREIEREIGQVQEDRIKQSNKIEEDLNNSIFEQTKARIEAVRRATITAAEDAAREQLRINQDTQRQRENRSENDFQAEQARIKANSSFRQQLQDLEMRRAKASTEAERAGIDAEIQKLKSAQAASSQAADETKKAQDERDKAVADAQLNFNKEFEAAKTKEEKDAAIARFNAAVKAADDRLAAEQAIIQDILQARIDGDKEAERQLKEALAKRLADIEAGQAAEIKRIQDTANQERQIREAQAAQEEADFQASLQRQRDFAAQQLKDLKDQADMRLMALEMALEKERRAEARSLAEKQSQLAAFLAEQTRQLGLAGLEVNEYIGSVLTSFGLGIDKIREFLGEVQKINQATAEATKKVDSTVSGNPFDQNGSSSGNNSNTSGPSSPTSNSFGGQPDGNSNLTFKEPNSTAGKAINDKQVTGGSTGKETRKENEREKQKLGNQIQTIILERDVIKNTEGGTRAKETGNETQSEQDKKFQELKKIKAESNIVTKTDTGKSGSPGTRTPENPGNGAGLTTVTPTGNVNKTFNFNVQITVQAPNVEGRQLAQSIGALLEPRIRQIATQLLTQTKAAEERQSRQQKIGELGPLAFLPSELI